MIVTKDSPRWDRLVADLAVAGVQVTVNEGRYPGGTSYSISLPLPTGGRVEVHDKWWRRNADRWIGWEVHTEDGESIVTRTWPRTTKRSEVVAAVAAALRVRR